jgi:hypothetical protein
MSEVLDFVSDGTSMLIRSFLLQGSFFAAMVVASRELGPHGLAAHHVVTQLWMLSSYLVDGMATAGSVLGSAMVGEAAAAAAARPYSPVVTQEAATHDERSVVAGGSASASDAGDMSAPAQAGEQQQQQRHHQHQLPSSSATSSSSTTELMMLPALRSLCHRLLALGLFAGCVFAGALVAAREPLIAAFTRDPVTAAILRSDSVWHILAGAQPLNAVVFVYDGLIYSFQEFGFVRELMEVGVGFVFLPALAAAAGASPPTLAGVWAAKVGLNTWRALGLGTRIHGWLLTPRGLSKHVRAVASRSSDEPAPAPAHVDVGGGPHGGGDNDGGEAGGRGTLRVRVGGGKYGDLIATASGGDVQVDVSESKSGSPSLGRSETSDLYSGRSSLDGSAAAHDSELETPLLLPTSISPGQSMESRKG